MYDFDPLASIPKEKANLVLGAEVHLWTELTDSANMDTLTWPRASAAAEVLWSGSKYVTGTNRSFKTVAPRLAEFRERLVARGVMAEPVQMPYCLMEPYQCDW